MDSSYVEGAGKYDDYTGSYSLMSGTSMATPHMAGLAALVEQYVKSQHPQQDAAASADLTNHLLVSTAVPQQENGVYVSPRRQGAGLVNAAAAISTPAYIDVDGKLVGKLELGDDPGWSGNYRYEWCYWLVAGWFVLLYGAFFALLFPAARKQLRPSFAPLAIIAGLAIAYSLLYILRNAHFFSTNLALTYTILIVVAVEITLATGILPSYAWYRETFYKLPFDLKVLTRNGQLAYSTAQAKPLSPETTEKITELGTLNGAAVDFRVPSNPHTLKRAYGISGGTALLSIDVSENDARRTALKQRKEELVNASELLKRSAAIRQGLALQEAERDLFEQINNSLAEKTSEINRLIDELPEDDSPESTAIRRQNLTRVKFLVAYCKRKGSLIVAEREGVSFTQEQVELVFTEAAADFRSMGIESAALFRLNKPLSPAIMARLYDCAYNFASLAFAIKNPTLLLFGENDERSALTVRIVLQCEESRKLEPSLQNFCNSLTKAGIRNCHQIEADEIAVKIKLEDSAL